MAKGFGGSASKKKALTKKNGGGPKGKKARAKAKLDKQWGEATVYDKGRTTTRQRRPPLQPQPQRDSRIGDDGGGGGGGRDNGGEGGASNRLYHRKELSPRQQDQRQRRRQQQQRQGDNDSSEPSDDDDDDDNSNTSNTEENPLNDLLSMIRKTRHRHRRHERHQRQHGGTTSKRAQSSGSKKGVAFEDEEEEDDGDDKDPIKATTREDPQYNDSDDDDDDDDDDISSDDSDDVSMDESNDDNDIDLIADHNEDDVDGTTTATTTDQPDNGTDIFRQRFGRSPIGTPQQSTTLVVAPTTATATTTSKITLVTGRVELQVSVPKYPPKKEMDNDHGDDGDPILDTMEELVLTTDLGRNWQQVALDTFQATNRSVLQRQWKKRVVKKQQQHQHQAGNYEMIMPNDIQAAVYTFLARYSDVFVTPSNRKEQRSFHQVYLLHILNHILTSRSRIARNNRILKDKEKAAAAEAAAVTATALRNDGDAVNVEKGGEEEEEDPDRFRDQGFTRPTVLVLLPTRGTCHRFVKGLVRIVGTRMEKEQEERFEAEFGPTEAMDEDDDDDDDDNNGRGKNRGLDPEKERRRKAVLEKKGKEWNELFGDTANQDDDFKMGISLTPKAAKGKNAESNVSVRVYTDFFKSDLIVASPLGLKMLIAPNEDINEDEDEENDGKKRGKGGFDYLSSIEICLLQHSDVMMMQNWDHVNDILSLLNQEPQNNNNTDFSRVRNYLLEGQGAHWRQVILSSKFVDPTLNSSFKRFGKSLSGSIKMRRKTANEDAAISRVLVPVKQIFQKVPAASLALQGQARVDYLVKNILPEIQRHKQTHTLIYIPSYFDYCSFRNALLKRDVSFVSITEYSRTSEIGRGRARFLQGRKPIMLYTGRANYFHRHAIKGGKHLIFLGLPEHSDFYADYVNLIGSASSSNPDDGMDGAGVKASAGSCLVLFTKYEAHALERVVGSSNCSRMLGSPKMTFMFYS